MNTRPILAVLNQDSVSINQFLLFGVFQVSAQPVATSRNNLFLRLAYTSPQTRKDGNSVRFMLKIWLPLESEWADLASQLKQGDLVQAGLLASLAYENAQTREEGRSAFFPVIRSGQLIYLERLGQDEAIEQAEDAEPAIVDQSAEPVQAERPVRAQRQVQEHQQQAQKPAVRRKPELPDQRRAVRSPNWDEPQSINLDAEIDQDMEDPFADVDLAQLKS